MTYFVKMSFWILKLLVKMILLPVVIALTIMQCIFTVAASITSAVFSLIGFVIIMIGVLSAGFDLEQASEIWKMIVIGAGFCIFPLLVEWFAADLALLGIRLRGWLMT